MDKSRLQRLIANDELESALHLLGQFTHTPALDEFHSETRILSGRLEAYKKHLRDGGDSAAALPERGAIRAALEELTARLPDQAPAPPKKKGLSERRFKLSLFWLVLFGKISVALWLWFQADTGGFSPKEVSSTISLLVPVFMAHLVPMFNDFLKNRYYDPFEPPAPERRMRWMLPLITYLVILPVYFGAMLHIMGLRGSGVWTFENMTAGLTSLEAILGVYLGVIIESVFKNNAST